MYTRTGFIECINCFIREVTVGYITVCQLDTSFQCRIRIIYVVMIFIFILNITKNLQRFVSCSRLYHYLLETTLQRPVFFDILPIFVKGSGTDTLNLSTRQCRLQHVGSIHRSGCRSGTYNGMYLVNEQNHIRILLQFVQDGTNAFLKLSAVLGTGNNRSHIECNHTLVKQNTGHLFLYNTKCQTFHYGRFSDSRFTDQNGVILLTAT